MEPKTTRFSDLKIGERFKFRHAGSLLTKSGPRSYDSPQWGQFGNWLLDPEEEEVIPEADLPGAKE